MQWDRNKPTKNKPTSTNQEQTEATILKEENIITVS